MVERYLQSLSIADASNEDLAGTRERLKDRFPRGSTRRMTQLGLLVGAALDELSLQAGDTIVYASAFAESRALESYLDSFPSASPTLFLAAQEKSSEVRMTDVERAEQGRFAGLEQLAKAECIVGEFAAVSVASRHAQAEQQEFLEREKMPEDLAQRRRASQQRCQVVA